MMTKAEIICSCNDIPYNIKHEHAIQEIDTFMNTFPNYHTIASQGIPTKEQYIYDKVNDQWSRYMVFHTNTLTVTNNQIIINSN